VGTDGSGLNRSSKGLSDTPVELHPWDAQSLAADSHGGILDGFQRRRGCVLDHQFHQDFAIGQASNAWTVLVGQRATGLGRHARRRVSSFKKTVFNRRPARKFSVRKSSRCLKDRSAGPVVGGAQNGLGCWNGGLEAVFTPRADGPFRKKKHRPRRRADAAGNMWIGRKIRGWIFFRDGKLFSRRPPKKRIAGR